MSQEAHAYIGTLLIHPAYGTHGRGQYIHSRFFDKPLYQFRIREIPVHFFIIDTYARDSAELSFHRTARHEWRTAELAFPPPYAGQYAAKLKAVLEGLPESLRRTDLLRLRLSGEAHQDVKAELERRCAAIEGSILKLETDASHMECFSGANPADLPPDSLLGQYLQRCAVEAAQAGAEPEIYELARRFGWLLFSGKGLPTEIQQ